MTGAHIAGVGAPGDPGLPQIASLPAGPGAYRRPASFSRYAVIGS